MQPASSTGADRSRQLRRWGPIVGVVVLVAVDRRVWSSITRDSDDDSTARDDHGSRHRRPRRPRRTTPATSTGDDRSTAPASRHVADTTTAPGRSHLPAVVPAGHRARHRRHDRLGRRAATPRPAGSRCPTSSRRPCFAPFTGDNGGATAPGVTGDEITIVYYEGQETDPIIAYITDAMKVDDTNGDQFATMKELVRYYETYYELYGRKVNLVTFEGTGNAIDEVAARADAARDRAGVQAVRGVRRPGAHQCVRRRVGSARGHLHRLHARPAAGVLQRPRSVRVGSRRQPAAEAATCRRVPDQADHREERRATAATRSKDQPRKFGLLYLENSGAAKDLADTFAADMEAAGSPFAEVVAYQLDPATIQATASQVITKMKAAGVTTIVFNGDPVAPRDFTKEATAQEYFPEWVVVGQHAGRHQRVRPHVRPGAVEARVRRHAARCPHADRPVGYRSTSTSGSTASSRPPTDRSVCSQPNPALFFAVVQGVGPNLTPRRGATLRSRCRRRRRPGDQPAVPVVRRQGLLAERGLPRVSTTPRRSGGTRPRPGPTRSARTASACTSSSTAASATCRASGRRTTRCSIRRAPSSIYTTPPPGEAPGDYPSPAG